jgi:hypothetical protein
MRVEEAPINKHVAAARQVYQDQQTASSEAQNKVEPVQKDQPAQATGTAATVDTYA